MATEDREAQEDELLSLASIYSEDEFKRAESGQGGEIGICVELPHKFRIFVHGDSTKTLQKYSFRDAICFLPPVFLNFEFPPDYPSTSAPDFTLRCKWLVPAQVKELVGEQLFSRYDRLLLQSSLDLMADVVYCPRLSCQMPVMKEPGCTIGICSSCGYPFCTLCKRTSHGIAPCKTEEPVQEKLSDEVQIVKPHRREKQRAWEDKQSAMFIEEEAQRCPVCKIPIQKDGGCDILCCARCEHKFLWDPFKSLSKKPG